MANWQVALKFYLNVRKVLFTGHIEDPIVSSIRVDAREGVPRRVTLPDSDTRTVLDGGAELSLVDGKIHRLHGVLRYADVHGVLSDEPEDWTVSPNRVARLAVTILYDPADGGPTRSLVINATDPSPRPNGDPFTPNDIDLFPDGDAPVDPVTYGKQPPKAPGRRGR